MGRGPGRWWLGPWGGEAREAGQEPGWGGPGSRAGRGQEWTSKVGGPPLTCLSPAFPSSPAHPASLSPHHLGVDRPRACKTKGELRRVHRA